MSDAEKIAVAFLNEFIALTAMRYSRVKFGQSKNGFFWVAHFRRFATGHVASVEFATINQAKENFLQRIK